MRFCPADEIATAGTGTFTEYSYGFAQAGGSGPYREFTTVTEHLADAQSRVTTTTSGVLASVTLHGTTFGPAAYSTTADSASRGSHFVSRNQSRASVKWGE
jgi:hypothetical protein